MNPVDTIYKQVLKHVPEFTFDRAVAEVFDDMVNRSVPCYSTVQDLTGTLCARLVPKNSTIVDLGCSTGESICRALELGMQDVRIVGVDSSADMLEACARKLKKYEPRHSIELICSRIEEIEIPKCSIVILNYTLQFVPFARRSRLLARIGQSLDADGLLILSEKVQDGTTGLDDLLVDLHHSLKQANGYSSLEISQKREALENVLSPLSTDENIMLLRKAGFEQIRLMLKVFNFATFLARKRDIR